MYLIVTSLHHRKPVTPWWWVTVWPQVWNLETAPVPVWPVTMILRCYMYPCHTLTRHYQCANCHPAPTNGQKTRHCQPWPCPSLSSVTLLPSFCHPILHLMGLVGSNQPSPHQGHACQFQFGPFQLGLPKSNLLMYEVHPSCEPASLRRLWLQL